MVFIYTKETTYPGTQENDKEKKNNKELNTTKKVLMLMQYLSYPIY